MISPQLSVELVPYLFEENLLWTVLGMWLFAIGTYSKATPTADYPFWFWGSYLLMSGAILVHISSGYYARHVVTEYLLVISAMLFSGGFFLLMRAWVRCREEKSDLMSVICLLE